MCAFTTKSQRATHYIYIYIFLGRNLFIWILLYVWKLSVCVHVWECGCVYVYYGSHKSVLTAFIKVYFKPWVFVLLPHFTRYLGNGSMMLDGKIQNHSVEMQDQKCTRILYGRGQASYIKTTDFCICACSPPIKETRNATAVPKLN